MHSQIGRYRLIGKREVIFCKRCNLNRDLRCSRLVAADIPNTLEDFISEIEPSEKTLLLLNRQGPEPLVELLNRAFEHQSISVSERHIPEGISDLVCLVDDGEVEALTPLSTLQEAFLMVNVDRYRTGTRQSAIGEFPDVLTGLSDVEFTVRGFPKSNKEKLLLVLISRFIEHRALSHDAGELHSAFQRLSRLDDEYGTQTMYELLAESDVATHVYGTKDDPDTVANLDVTVHSGDTEEYRRSWLVVFTPDAPAESRPEMDGHAALVASETGKNVYRGMWTYDSMKVERIRRYIRRSY